MERFSARGKCTEGMAIFKDKDKFHNKEVEEQRGTSSIGSHVMQNEEEETERESVFRLRKGYWM